MVHKNNKLDFIKSLKFIIQKKIPVKRMEDSLSLFISSRLRENICQFVEKFATNEWNLEYRKNSQNSTVKKKKINKST